MTKAYNFCSFLVLLLIAIVGKAQDSTLIVPRTKNILVSAQYAGSIGFLSLGTGITNRSHTLHQELFYGFTSAAYGGPLSKITYKISYYPFSVRLNKKVAWQPLNVTGFASYHLGKKFTLLHSFKKYENGYYPWSPALRFHVGLSTSFTFKQDSGRDLQFYLETNTNDLYISTLYDNVGYMAFTDIWFLGLGVKMKLAR